MFTCEWQHYKLYNEDFKDWVPPSLPKDSSKSLNAIYKKFDHHNIQSNIIFYKLTALFSRMLKVSTTQRSSPSKLITFANNAFPNDQVLRHFNCFILRIISLSFLILNHKENYKSREK